MNNVSLTAQNTFRVHILNSDKEDFITPFEATPSSDGWFDVDLITYDITITEEVDFYVAFEFLADETLCICGTSTYSYPYRGYLWNGTNWVSDYVDLMIRATVLNNVYPETDETPPEIGVPSQNPPSNNVKAGEEVKVSVDVTAIENGVKNVTLFYTTNNWDYWENRAMTYNPSTGLYEATILGQEEGTLVEFRIDAYNNAGSKATQDETEPYSTYRVIPEFSTFGIPLILIVATLTIIVYRKKHCSHLLKNARQAI